MVIPLTCAVKFANRPVLIALVNVVHYVMTMILMLVDVLHWPLRKRCVMSFVRLLLLLLKCVGLSTSFLFYIFLFLLFFFDCIVCFCMSCSLFTAFVANKLHHKLHHNVMGAD